MIYEWKAKEPFTGYVKIEVLKQRERTALATEFQFTTTEGGEVEVNEDLAKQIDKMREIVTKYVKEVCLTHIESKAEFKNLDDLEYYEEYQTVQSELFGLLVKGPKLGNG